jgi:hypothetical protein
MRKDEQEQCDAVDAQHPLDGVMADRGLPDDILAGGKGAAQIIPKLASSA